MSTFRRRGHYRRGPNGQQVWVSEHSVTRSSGKGYQYAPSTFSRPQNTPPATVAPAFIRWPKSLLWVKANALCPVCGAAVFFYSNEFGSRVYFDEVGPPWPKHPCTDNPQGRGIGDAPTGQRVSPPLHEFGEGYRKLAEARRIHISNSRSPSPSSNAMTLYDVFTVQGSWQNERGTFFQLQRLYESSDPEGWGTPDYVSMEQGQVVFISGQELSYLEVGRLGVVRFPVFFQSHIRKISEVVQTPKVYETGQSSQTLKIREDSLLQRLRKRLGR